MSTSQTLTQNLRVRVAPATEQAVKAIAERDERSVGDIIRRAIREYVERDAQSQEV